MIARGRQALPVRAPRLRTRPRRARRDGRRGRGGLDHRGEATSLFELAKEHGRDRLTSGIWERALEHGDRLATKLVDRAVEVYLFH